MANAQPSAEDKIINEETRISMYLSMIENERGDELAVGLAVCV
jgi:hypothetical protein